MKASRDKQRLTASATKPARGKKPTIVRAHTSGASGTVLKAKAKVKNVGGRPTSYLPKFCREVLVFMAKGFSLSAFAGSIGVSRETIYAWSESITEFGEALAKARAARTLYWETRLQTAEKDTRAVIFALRNACSEEWKDKPEVAVIVNNAMTVDTSKPPEEMGEAELRFELARRGALPVKGEVRGQKPAKIERPHHD